MKHFTTIVSLLLICGSSNAFALSLLDPSLIRCTPTGTSCSACTSYSCNSGYYGTATSSSAGCVACPSNATCAGGNDSTFVCNRGYYKNGTTCNRCPTEDGVTYGTTKDAGATSMTECYMPANTSVTDWTGTYIFTSDCYYDNSVTL